LSNEVLLLKKMSYQTEIAKMDLQQVFYDSLFAEKKNNISDDFTIKSAAKFNAILAKEKARADRNNHVFSLISFELVPQRSSIDSIIFFAHYLQNRLRITDEIGWLDNHSIGVLLFNSFHIEAKQFLEIIHRSCPPDICFGYAISTYPEGRTEHFHNEEIHRRLEEKHLPGLESATEYEHQGETDKRIAKRLHPVFFNRVSFWKRLIDIVLSIIALIVLSPLMLMIALVVMFTSKGPIFYKQKRAGLGGVPFTMLKFRTMKVGAEEMKSQLKLFNERTGPVFKMINDPRVTPIGKILRQWSLDELPQFVNVLKGDMTLVGPRPPTLDEVEQYNKWHNYRLEMRPGITCIWQVYARHDKSFDNWVRLDIKYKKEQSFLLDMKLIALTLPAVLSRRGAS
jgi:lipopolysaccharide/colanic/teichoic acid biosynthesis glycosyltransferase